MKKLPILIFTLVVGCLLSVVPYPGAREGAGFPVLTGQYPNNRIAAPTYCTQADVPDKADVRGLPFVTSITRDQCFGNTTHYALGWAMNLLVSCIVALGINMLIKRNRRRNS
ncbi:MAG TPA: hypothetical protein VF597_03485 [Candidatus Saccharimonadales bacterium]|jgi:hypothetical protein